MLAKLTCVLLMVSGCSSSAPPKPAAESAPAAAQPVAAPASAEPKVADDSVIVGLETEYAKLVESTDQHGKAVDDLKTFEGISAVQIRMDELIQARADLLQRADTAYIKNKYPPGSERLVELRDKLASFEKTLDETHAKFNDTQRALASAKLKELQKEKAEMDARSKAAKAKKR